MSKHKEELLAHCITWIWEHIDSYTDMIQTFKKLGFTNEELEEYDLRDMDFEEDVGLDEDDVLNEPMDIVEFFKTVDENGHLKPEYRVKEVK